MEHETILIFLSSLDFHFLLHVNTVVVVVVVVDIGVFVVDIDVVVILVVYYCCGYNMAENVIVIIVAVEVVDYATVDTFVVVVALVAEDIAAFVVAVAVNPNAVVSLLFSIE